MFLQSSLKSHPFWVTLCMQPKIRNNCLLYSVLYTMYSVLCTVYSVLCTVNSVLCTEYSVLCTVNSVLCTVYSVLCTVYSVLYSVNSVPCTMYVIHRTVCNVKQRTVQSLHRKVYSVQCTCIFSTAYFYQAVIFCVYFSTFYTFTSR